MDNVQYMHTMKYRQGSIRMNKPLSAMTNINLIDIRWRKRRQIQNVILFISSLRISKLTYEAIRR